MGTTKLSKYRERVEITQKELAKLCKISQSLISHHERRWKFLSLKTLMRVSLILSDRGPKVTISDLIEDEMDIDPEEVLAVLEVTSKKRAASQEQREIIDHLVDTFRLILKS